MNARRRLQPLAASLLATAAPMPVSRQCLGRILCKLRREDEPREAPVTIASLDSYGLAAIVKDA